VANGGVTGGSGTLGTELQKHLSCFAPDRSLLDITWPALEIIDELYSQQIKNIKGIIHAAAYTDVPGSENNKMEAIETNIIGTKNIAELSRLFNVPMYYISTDYVYPGVFGNYKETDCPRPLNFYAFTKLAGEAYVDLKKDLVIRTSFKPNDLWKAKYNRAFFDMWSSADYVDIVAKDIALAIEGKLNGTINIATERKTIYELAKRRFPNVGKVSVEEIKTVRLPRDISMNIDKFKEFRDVFGR